MKRATLRDRLRYRFGNFMVRGEITLNGAVAFFEHDRIIVLAED